MAVGVNQSNLCQLAPADLDRVCKDIAAYGFESVRFAVDWGNLSNFAGQVNYGPVHRVAAALNKHGLEPLPVLGIHHPFIYSTNTFADFVQRCVSIFGPIPAYEVWNEPNLWGFTVGTPARFLTYLRAAAPIIRETGAAVIHGGLAAYPDHRVFWLRNYSPVTWLKELYAAGERNDYDLLGYHPYSLTTAEKWVDPDSRPFGIAQIDALNTLRYQHGDARPYAFTEIGYDTTKIDATTAAKYLTAQMPSMRASSNHNWLFCWRDTVGDGGKYGLVAANNGPKLPLYNSVRGLL
ncbi:hypothetical protein AB4Z39_10855 [Mycobacterium adipatum]|uniref:hypothetical protein n=1 Tax=Mycobacterium adipatum TaxID=1682113 RepID=UPI0034E09EE5